MVSLQGSAIPECRGPPYRLFDVDLIPSVHSGIIVCLRGTSLGHDVAFNRSLQLFNVLFSQRGAVVPDLDWSFQIHVCR